MSNTNTLTIDLNEEYKIKIENPSELSKSFFDDIYRQAGEATNDILDKSYEKNDFDEEDTRKDNIKYFKRQNEEYNNIIAFCGDRGTGKSSAMLSFANSLMQIKNCDNIYDKTDLKSYQFFHIDVIDPSMFEEKENIFEVVLAQLFSSFENKLKDNNHDGNNENRRKVLELFETVYDNLKTIQKNGEKYNGEALETLSKLSCGANLRNNFKDLIKNYLDYLKKNKDSKACLIIPIDDFDLNIKAVADMAEQIRKYLMIPKVIILMAADIKQLSDAKEQSVRKDFKTLIDANSMSETPKSITAKYLLKLIPDERRLELPLINCTGKIKTISKGNKKPNTHNEIQDIFLELCYKHYHILFVKPKSGIHRLIPDNIRELKEWFIFLNRKTKDTLNAINLFNDRFINSYCNNYLEQNDFKIINTLNNTESNNLYKKIIEEILRLFNKNSIVPIDMEYSLVVGTDNENNIIKEFKHIIDRGNYSYNISLGDIILFLDVVERYHKTERFTKLIFSIKTLLSIRLKKCLQENTNLENNKEFKTLIGGYIFNHKMKSILAADRANFEIDYNSLDLENKDDISLYFLHFFVTRIGRDINYRQKPEVYYKKEFRFFEIIGKTTECTFDILAPLYSLYTSKDSIKRVFNTISHDRKEKDHNTLLLKFKKWMDKEKDFPFESIELIEYVIDYLTGKPFKGTVSFTSIINHIYYNINKSLDLFINENPYINIINYNYIKDTPLIIEILNDKDITSFFDSNIQESYSNLAEDEYYINISVKELVERVVLSKNEFDKKLSGKVKKGITIRNYINNYFTGANAFKRYSKYNPVIDSLIDDINKIKKNIDRSDSISLKIQTHILYQISNIIDSWIKNIRIRKYNHTIVNSNHE